MSEPRQRVRGASPSQHPESAPQTRELPQQPCLLPLPLLEAQTSGAAAATAHFFLILPSVFHSLTAWGLGKRAARPFLHKIRVSGSKSVSEADSPSSSLTHECPLNHSAVPGRSRIPSPRTLVRTRACPHTHALGKICFPPAHLIVGELILCVLREHNGQTCHQVMSSHEPPPHGSHLPSSRFQTLNLGRKPLHTQHTRPRP